MAKPWADVERDPAYQALSDDDKEAARNQYFEEVVAPQVDTPDLEMARAQFDEDTQPTALKEVGKSFKSVGKALGKGAGAAMESLGAGVEASGRATLSEQPLTEEDVEAARRREAEHGLKLSRASVGARGFRPSSTVTPVAPPTAAEIQAETERGSVAQFIAERGVRNKMAEQQDYLRLTGQVNDPMERAAAKAIKIPVGKFMQAAGESAVTSELYADPYHDATPIEQRLKERPFETIFVEGAKQTPNFVLSLAGGAIGARLGISPYATAGGTSFALEKGDIFQEGKEFLATKYNGEDSIPDIEWAKLNQLANEHGAFNAALDALTPGNQVARAMVGKALVRRLLSKEGVKYVGKEWAKDLAKEIPTELAQEESTMRALEQTGKVFTPEEKMQRRIAVVAGTVLPVTAGSVLSSTSAIQKTAAESPVIPPQADAGAIPAQDVLGSAEGAIPAADVLGTQPPGPLTRAATVAHGLRALPAPTIVVSPEGIAATEAQMQNESARQAAMGLTPDVKAVAQKQAERDAAAKAEREKKSVSDIHTLATSKNIPWDNDPDFMDFTESVTGKRHLDDLNPAGLKALYDALDKRPAVKPANEKRKPSLRDVVVRLGGISTEDRLDVTGDTKGNYNIPGVGHLFTPKGTSLDGMAEKLVGEGWFSEAERQSGDATRKLAEMLKDEVSGIKQHYPPGDITAKMQAEFERYYADQEEAERPDFEADPFFNPEPVHLELSGYNKADEPTKNLIALYAVGRQKMGSDAFEAMLESLAERNPDVDDDAFEALVRQEIERHGTETKAQAAAARAQSRGDIPAAASVDKQAQEKAVAQPVTEKPKRKPAPEAGTATPAKAGVSVSTSDKPSTYGKKNKVFTENAAAKARERLKKKLNQINAGLDPELMQDAMTLAGYHVESGARKFADFSKAMIADIGEAIRPYLKSLYLSVRNWPGFDNAGMETEAQIDAATSEAPKVAPEAKTGTPAVPGQMADMFGGKSDTAQTIKDREIERQKKMDEAPPVESGEGDLFSGKSKQTDIEDAAAQAATSPENNLPEPTDAQKDAGNYKKGHITLHGLDISIENPAGTRRRPEWPPLVHHYGYIKGTVGKDKDHIDVFLGPAAEDPAKPVFIVDQKNPKNATFDEHKILLGFDDEKAAREGYLANYAKGWKGLGAITRMSLDEFKDWLQKGDTKKPAANAATEQEVLPALAEYVSKNNITASRTGKDWRIFSNGKRIDIVNSKSWIAQDLGITAGSPNGAIRLHHATKVFNALRRGEPVSLIAIAEYPQMQSVVDKVSKETANAAAGKKPGDHILQTVKVDANAEFEAHKNSLRTMAERYGMREGKTPMHFFRKFGEEGVGKKALTVSIRPLRDPSLKANNQNGAKIVTQFTHIDKYSGIKTVAAPSRERIQYGSIDSIESILRQQLEQAEREAPATAVDAKDTKKEPPQEFDFVKTFPQPLDEAMREAGRAGLLDDVPEGGELEAIKGVHDETAIDLIQTLRSLDVVKDAEARGIDPNTGKPPRTENAKTQLRERIAEAKQELTQHFDDMLGSYEDAFGRDAARQFEKYVREQAGTEAAVDAEGERSTLIPEESDATDRNANLERDRQDAETADGVGQEDLFVESGGADEGGSAGARGADEAGRPADGGAGLPDREAAAPGERGDFSPYSEPEQPGLAGLDAGIDDGERGRDSGFEGIPPESVGAEAVSATAETGSERLHKKIAQQKAQTVKVIPGDLDNIHQSLPYLLPEQRGDVLFAEQRFAQPDGYGVLFGNSAGTGKTYTGLGILKRFERQGKSNILIVVPTDKVMQDWIESGKNLMLDIKPLGGVDDNGGSGLTITTYANVANNMTLADREWDHVLPDEAHYLMQAQGGDDTLALNTLRAITYHPRGVYTRHKMLYRNDWAKIDELEARKKANVKEMQKDDITDARAKKLESENKKIDEAIKPLMDKMMATRKVVEEDVAAHQGNKRPRATFLSATPFAYEKTVDWADGYLFEYGPEPEGRGYNQPNAQQAFMIQHFGYRMRTGKLTEPEADVDRGIMQRAFNGFLKKSGAMSTRTLNVDKDYDRRFIMVESAIGNKIDEGLQWLWDNRRYHALSEIVRDKFDHLTRRYLLEAINAREVVPLIKAHLALGRKVVVFHDFKKGGGFNPFDLSYLKDDETHTNADGESVKVGTLVREFMDKRRDLVELPLSGLLSPIATLSKAFPDILLFNGDIPKKQRRKHAEMFNADGSGKDLILVQSAAGKEGISLHDTTAKHPRVLFNLGLPTQPTTAIQQEGRIYRVGQASNAMFRYLNTGTNWERWAFAHTIATRSSTAENLVLGEQARALLDAFIDGFEESDAYPAGFEGEGTGGRERDRMANAVITVWDRAMTLYYGQQKKTARTKAAEGKDYFATPEPLGLKMVEWADLRELEHALEPSAGHGAIARWFPENTSNTAIEPSAALSSRTKLVMPKGKVLQERFEDHHVVNKYDAIVMNPPFGTAGRTAIDHLALAANHLRDGGRIVALIPEGESTNKKFEKWFYGEETRPLKPVSEHPEHGQIYKGDTVTSRASWAPEGKVAKAEPDGSLWVQIPGRIGASMITRESVTSVKHTGKRTETYRPAENLYLVADIKLPAVTFERAGTSVRAHVLIIDKAETKEWAPEGNVIRDYSHSQSIKDFFDTIQDASIPPRRKPRVVAEQTEKPDIEKPKETTASDIKLGEFKHSKNGTTMYAATLTRRLDGEEYKRVNALAKKHGGYYSAYKQDGAIPGFLFKSEASRQLFLDDMGPATELREHETEYTAGNEISADTREARPAAAGRKAARVRSGYDPQGVAWTVLANHLRKEGPPPNLDYRITREEAEKLDFIGVYLEHHSPDQTGEEGWYLSRSFGPDHRSANYYPGAPTTKEYTYNPTQRQLVGEIRVRGDQLPLLREPESAYAPIFYSALTRAVEGVKQEKAPALHWKNLIKSQPGVKQEELDWTGLFEWLDEQRGTVTKPQILDFLKANEVQVQEVTRGGGTISGEHISRVIEEVIKHGYTASEAADLVNRAERGHANAIGELEQTIPGKLYDELLGPFHEKPATKFESYQLPGGQNYRELLLTLPGRAPVEELHNMPTIEYRDDGIYVVLDGNTIGKFPDTADGLASANEQFEQRRKKILKQKPKDANFRSAHFPDVVNPVAHVRFNERTDAEGKRVLFIEEVQSDWHQQGRRKGYQSVVPEPDTKTQADAVSAIKRQDNFGYDYYAEALRDILNEDNWRAVWEVTDEADAMAIQKYVDEEKAYRASKIGVPDAPFKTTWPLLAMKRMIRYAAENGFDRIAWTTGEQQAERYDLSKQLQKVTVIKKGELFNIKGIDLNGEGHDFGTHAADKLESVVGKELAAKIADQKTPNEVYAGNDLKVGGEGMKAFYDQMLPSMVKKYVKKWGGKVGETNLSRPPTVKEMMNRPGRFEENTSPHGMIVHSLDITPAMRDSAMQGQSLFEPKPEYTIQDDLFAKDATEEQKQLAQEALADLNRFAPGRSATRRGTLLGSSIPAEFAEKGKISLVGQTATSPEDLAVLAQVYRDPRFETFRIFFLKGNTIVGQTGVTSRLPGATQTFIGRSMDDKKLYTAMLRAAMKKTGADGYYLLHNHPSGLPDASPADINVTDDLRGALGEFKFHGHVIINENKYGVIKPDGVAQVIVRPLVSDYSLRRGKPTKAHPLLGQEITSPQALAAAVKQVQVSKDYIVLIGTNRNGVRGIMEIPKDVLKSRLRAVAVVRKFARDTGSVDVFAAGIPDADIELARQAIKYGVLRDAIYESGRHAHLDEMRDSKAVMGRVGAPGMHAEETPLAYGEEPKENRLLRPARKATMESDSSIFDHLLGGKFLFKAVGRLGQKTGAINLLHRAYDATLARTGELLPESVKEKVKAGVISNYGLDKDYQERKADMQAAEAAMARKSHGMIEMLANLSRAESRVAYYWMQEKPDGDVEKALMAKLPEASRQTLKDLKQLISDLGREAVRLGQLSADSYARNDMAYVHRTYAKHVLAEEGVIRRMLRSRALRIKGEQYKGRGIFEEVDMERIQNIAPDFWKRKLQKGQADASMKGEKFIRFEKRDASGEVMDPLPGMTAKPLGRLRAVEYWPASEPVPARYGHWVNAGEWTVRGTKGDKLIMWRDLTKAERQRLGELDEVRYAVAQTLQMMVHDIEVGRFFEWVGGQYAKKKPEGEVVAAHESLRHVYGKGTWVKVPETEIPGTSVKKYGALSGLYIPGPVWSDMRQIAAVRYEPWGRTYANVLRFWKKSKTAWTPGVHMNNVMANFIMADWHDIRAVDLYDALKVWTNRDEDGYKQLFERFQDSGALGGMFASNELLRNEINERLKELKADLMGESAQAETGNMAKVLQLVSLAIKPAKAYAGGMEKAYQAEDEFFRLAVFLKAIRYGHSDRKAGSMARHAFLNYDINAPWIQALRHTALPFISFFYRAFPMFLQTVKNKPWKVAKLMAFWSLLSALGYAMTGDDDEERQRKRMPEEKSGRVWGLVPKMIRMPWSYEGQPVFLDIRRWVPVGDIADLELGSGWVPPPLVPGGPLVTLAEVMPFINKSLFTQKEIYKDTDTFGEASTKVMDHLFKSVMPNVPVPNPVGWLVANETGQVQTYAWSGIEKAITRKENQIGEVRSVPQALLNTVGVKVGTYPANNMLAAIQAGLRRDMESIDQDIARVGRNYARLERPSDADKERRDKAIARQIQKKRELVEDARERMGR